MTSNLQSTLELIQLNDYISVVIVTAVIYDYFLTLPREIDYVWCRSWTWVSTMFVLVRYIGLCWAILNGLVGSTFVPGPLMVSVSALIYYPPHYQYKHRYPEGTVLYLVIYWGFPIFLTAADLVMILRVYAMWNQSKWILSVLLSIYVPQVIISFILAGIYYNPNTYFSVTIFQVIDFSLCNGLSKIPSPLLLGIAIPRFVLAAALLVLAAIRTLKQSVDMYKATKLWQPNHYMRQLIRDGILYFLVNVLYNTHDVIVNGRTINATSMLVLSMLSYISICPIMPRFIISVRELHDHLRGLRGHWQGVDTGFGLMSRSASENATLSVVAFTDITLGQSESAEGEAGDNTNQV